jgi:hypothetical protein
MNFLLEIFKFLTEDVLLEKLSPVFYLNQYHKGVLLRRGVFVRELHTGWNFKLPITDRFLTCNSQADTYYLSNVNITTTDDITASVSACFEVWITDPFKYLLEANDAPSNIRDIAMGVLAGELIDLNWDEISRRKTLNAIMRNLNRDLKSYGVEISRFWFTDITKTRSFTLINQ